MSERLYMCPEPGCGRIYSKHEIEKLNFIWEFSCCGHGSTRMLEIHESLASAATNLAKCGIIMLWSSSSPEDSFWVLLEVPDDNNGFVEMVASLPQQFSIKLVIPNKDGSPEIFVMSPEYRNVETVEKWTSRCMYTGSTGERQPERQIIRPRRQLMIESGYDYDKLREFHDQKKEYMTWCIKEFEMCVRTVMQMPC